MIYSFPAASSGIELDSDLLIELSELPNCFGTKVSRSSLATCETVDSNRGMFFHSSLAPALERATASPFTPSRRRTSLATVLSRFFLGSPTTSSLLSWLVTLEASPELVRALARLSKRPLSVKWGLLTTSSRDLSFSGNVIPKTIVKLYDTAIKAIETGDPALFKEAQKLQDIGKPALARVGFR